MDLQISLVMLIGIIALGMLLGFSAGYAHGCSRMNKKGVVLMNGLIDTFNRVKEDSDADSK